MLNKLYIYSHRQFYLNATHERLRNTPISLELCHFEKSYIVGFFFILKKNLTWLLLPWTIRFVKTFD